MDSELYLKTSPSWSYGSWVYSYLCIQSLSPLTLWVRIPLRRGVLDTTLCDESWYSDLRRSGVFSWYSGFLHQWNWPPRYRWNSVESGVKHHSTNTNPVFENSWKKLSRNEYLKFFFVHLLNILTVSKTFNMCKRCITIQTQEKKDSVGYNGFRFPSWVPRTNAFTKVRMRKTRTTLYTIRAASFLLIVMYLTCIIIVLLKKPQMVWHLIQL